MSGVKSRLIEKACTPALIGSYNGETHGAHLSIMNKIVLLLLLASSLLGSQSALADQKLPRVALNIGIHLVHAEVAANDTARQQGLMFRQTMRPNEGMVFVFEVPVQLCMWMKNTYLPLSVAFLDQEGRILNIEDMQPQTTNRHCAIKPALYALEMNQGWFKKKNIRPGTKVMGLPQ